MFTRIVELTAKPGKTGQLADTIDDKVLPILKKQKGFVDETVFVSDKDDNRVLAQGFWNTKEDAEQYHRAEYQKVHESIRHLLDSEPVIRTFNVHSSTNVRSPRAKPPEALSGRFPLQHRRGPKINVTSTLRRATARLFHCAAFLAAIQTRTIFQQLTLEIREY